MAAKRIKISSRFFFFRSLTSASSPFKRAVTRGRRFFHTHALGQHEALVAGKERKRIENRWRGRCNPLSPSSFLATLSSWKKERFKVKDLLIKVNHVASLFTFPIILLYIHRNDSLIMVNCELWKIDTSCSTPTLSLRSGDRCYFSLLSSGIRWESSCLAAHQWISLISDTWWRRVTNPLEWGA